MSNVLTNANDTLAKPVFKNQYENYIGGKWVAPTKGQYF